MSHTFSFYKPTAVVNLLLAGVTGSLLALGLVPTMTPQVEKSVSQLSTYSSDLPQELEEQFDKSALVLAAMIAGGVATGLVLKQTKSRRGSTTGHLSLLSQENNIAAQASRKLQRRLFTLLHEDREAANRLLTLAKLRYPNKTADWYVEKVIYDLERDRGGY
jgi:hypothetical protein